jgi:CRP-like cAMP-binding protein
MKAGEEHRARPSDVAARPVTVFDELSEQAFLSVRQRIVVHLLNLVVPGDGSALVVRATHEELAEAVASDREVVTRNLHRIRDDGLIALTRDGIVVKDPIGLAREISPRGRALSKSRRARGSDSSER